MQLQFRPLNKKDILFIIDKCKGLIAAYYSKRSNFIFIFKLKVSFNSCFYQLYIS